MSELVLPAQQAAAAHNGRDETYQFINANSYAYLGMGVTRPDTATNNNPCSLAFIPGATPNFKIFAENEWFIQDGAFNRWIEFFSTNDCRNGTWERCWGYGIYAPNAQGVAVTVATQYNLANRCGSITNQNHDFKVLLVHPSTWQWQVNVDNGGLAYNIPACTSCMFPAPANNPRGAVIMWGLESNVYLSQYSAQDWHGEYQ
ncbi:MAG: hypothetical protein JOZ37_02435, partial [Actinobacteria bacterium]|nr:hypothetical protein [Actinomycetota bacterium]